MASINYAILVTAVAIFLSILAAGFYLVYEFFGEAFPLKRFKDSSRRLVPNFSLSCTQTTFRPPAPRHPPSPDSLVFNRRQAPGTGHAFLSGVD